MKKYKSTCINLKEGRHIIFSCIFYKTIKSFKLIRNIKYNYSFCRDMDFIYNVEEPILENLNNIRFNHKVIKELVKSKFFIFAKRYNLKLEVK